MKCDGDLEKTIEKLNLRKIKVPKEKLEEIKKTPLRSVCKFEKYVDDNGRNVFEASCNFTEKYSHLKRIRFYENQTPDEVQDTVNRWFDIRDFYVIYNLNK